MTNNLKKTFTSEMFNSEAYLSCHNLLHVNHVLLSYITSKVGILTYFY